MGDPQFAKYPNLQLSQHIFQLTNPASSKAAKQASLQSLQDAVTEHKMAPLYRYLAHPVDGVLNAPGEGTAAQPAGHRRPSSGASTILATKNPSLEVSLPWDEQLYESLTAENEKELEAIQKEEDEAVEKAGETEIQAARGKRAEYYTRIGDKVSSSTVVSAFRAYQYVHRRKPSPPTRPFSKRPAFWAPKSTSSSQ